MPNSSLKKIATGAVVIASMLAADVGPLATAANAGDFSRGYQRDHGDFDRDRGFGRGGPGRDVHDRFDGPRGRHYGWYRHRDHSGRAVAIGLGALMIGAILAAKAHDHDRYDRYDR